LKGRLTITGPTTAAELAQSLQISHEDTEAALMELESEGVVLRGRFTAGVEGLEWCDRRLLSRVHRYTIHRLRAEISPCAPADFMRFLFSWQHVYPTSRLSGVDGLRAVLTQLDGLELPMRAWEREVLTARIEHYEPTLLDTLCLTGEISWARLSSWREPAAPSAPHLIGASAVAVFRREHGDAWLALRRDEAEAESSDSSGQSKAFAPQGISETAWRVLDRLTTHGASFAQELMASCELTESELRTALGELAATGLASSDGFAGLREIVGGERRTARHAATGRWFAMKMAGARITREQATERWAWAMIRRYGVIFRRLLAREASDVPWRELVRVYRRLEARGEIRGGRFVSGMSGEQFALPEAVERLREVRRSPPDNLLITIAAADPLNLTGVIVMDERIRASTTSRVVFRNGVPVAALEGDFLRMLAEVDGETAVAAATAAAGRRVPVLSGFVGRLHSS
jgi:ATP-dependent Lhr-like helicase